MSEAISKWFEQVKSKKDFIKTKEAQELRSYENLSSDLRGFWKTSKFSNDDEILFNWAIGTALSLSLNEIASK